MATPDKFERVGGTYSLTQISIEDTGVNRTPLSGVITVQPFMLDGGAYVSLTDRRAAWTVMVQCRGGGRRGSLLSSCGGKIGNRLFHSISLGSQTGIPYRVDARYSMQCASVVARAFSRMLKKSASATDRGA